MNQRTVHVAVYDTYADWEVGHAAAHIRNGDFQIEPGRYGVRTVGPTTAPVTSMGGLRVLPDLALADLDPADSAMLILPGAAAWDESPETLAPFARTARAFIDAAVPVAAICGGTAGLAREGLLDARPHTSAVADYLAATGYAGGGHYRDADAVRADGVITAGPTDQVAFAREVFAELGLYRPEVLDAWFRLFARSDPSAFGVLASA
ncbi:putative intracellular protease/amidase [Murinocardiopsis flavida]|uniref:Putative intracellular protease/amidase n=1 Tax=Murinocardiopsis flavida TaxID=645275 RepID=A0A2P8CUX9_9ACTN|nr:DJ-1/PfpI family protein [Murinocardiopsis flavida]PSK88770.1 putative intracellular protease/amidase [Murinocardiopsis flavida]